MKSRSLISIAMTLCASPVSFPLAAHEGNNLSAASREYTVEVLLGLGGLTNVTTINGRGWVIGVSNPPGDNTDHIILWRNGQLTDIGIAVAAALGGHNSAPPGSNRNERGWVVGSSETKDNDPYAENFCGFIGLSSSQLCRGFLWQSETNKVSVLPPLPGGNNSAANGANSEEIFGSAENGVYVGPTNCVPPQVYLYEGVVWKLGPDGTPFVSRRLSPIADDAFEVSAGGGINEDGDIVGVSGPCGQAPLSKHAVLWKKDGRVIDLTTPGEAIWNVANSINNEGQIAGSVGVPSANFPPALPHAALWNEEGVMQDLGALPGNDSSAAQGINDRGELVGLSCNAAQFFNGDPLACHGFHWQRGVMTDLNSAADPPLCTIESPICITSGQDINSRGEIVVTGWDPNFYAPNVGETVAAILIPKR